LSTTARRITADELWRMPDDGFRYELVEGELIRLPLAGFEHGAVVGVLTSLLARDVKDHQLGLVPGAGTGFLIGHDPDTVRAPDVAFVRRERLAASGLPKAFYPGAPDLAAEVVSPGDTSKEVAAKAGSWVAAGTALVWVVDPGSRSVTVYRPGDEPVVLGEDDVLEGGESVPGFRCRVGDLFVSP